MKKLEKKILDKVYRFETKRTIKETVVKTGLILLSLLTLGYVAYSVFQQLQSAQALDLLQLFQEDFETIKMYIAEVADTLYQELPKNEIVILLIAFITLIILLLFFAKNFAKIKQRTKAIIKFWFKK